MLSAKIPNTTLYFAEYQGYRVVGATRMKAISQLLHRIAKRDINFY